MKLCHSAAMSVALAAGVFAGSDSEAHCVPGDIHMHGQSGVGAGYQYYDTGCVYKGTVSEGCTDDYCLEYDPEWSGYCLQWAYHCDYNCDGC